MSQAQPCPDVQILERLVLGQLAATEMDALEKHLTQCDRCGATMMSLRAEDTLVEALRASARGENKRPELVERLIERMKQQVPDAASQVTAACESVPAT